MNPWTPLYLPIKFFLQWLLLFLSKNLNFLCRVSMVSTKMGHCVSMGTNKLMTMARQHVNLECVTDRTWCQWMNCIKSCLEIFYFLLKWFLTSSLSLLSTLSINLKTKVHIDNSLSIKIESKDVTFENVPKNSFWFWSASYNAHALVIAAVMYFALVHIDRHCKII